MTNTDLVKALLMVIGAIVVLAFAVMAEDSDLQKQIDELRKELRRNQG